MSKAKVFAGVTTAVLNYINPTILKMSADIADLRKELAELKIETRYLSKICALEKK